MSAAKTEDAMGRVHSATPSLSETMLRISHIVQNDPQALLHTTTAELAERVCGVIAPSVLSHFPTVAAAWQLLSLYSVVLHTSLRLGRNPDTPSRLAKVISTP